MSTNQIDTNRSYRKLRVQQGCAAPMRRRHKVFRAFVRALFNFVFHVRVSGLNNLLAGPAIIAPNHLGWADPFLIMLYMPAEPRIYALGLHPAEASFFRTWIVDKLEVLVAIDRANPRSAVEQARSIVERGGSVLVFPEAGTVGGQEGEVRHLVDGAAYLSVATGLPLVPVGITGTRELWFGKRLRLQVGTPLLPTEFAGDTNRTRARRMTVALAAAISSLLPGEQHVPRFKPLRSTLTALFK